MPFLDNGQDGTITDWMVQMLNKLNQHYVNKGDLDPLCYNEIVILVAQDHNQGMVDNNMFSHTGSDGSQPWTD